MTELKSETVWLVYVDVWMDDEFPQLVSFSVKRTPKQVKVSRPLDDIVRRAIGYRTLFTPDDWRMRGSSPEAAIAQWRERMDEEIAEHEKELTRLRKTLDRDPVEAT